MGTLIKGNTSLNDLNGMGSNVQVKVWKNIIFLITYQVLWSHSSSLTEDEAIMLGRTKTDLIESVLLMRNL